MKAKKVPVVIVREEEIILPTYLPDHPDPHPMFLEKRVYQGSSGRVYPLPFTDRIAEHPVDRAWKGIWIENEYLRALVLPELGGRVHALQDKTNGVDLIYRQEVIKPALVGLAGPWISGGIEFNWPQHHRPATFLPVETHIERGEDGSVTVWCGDHDPMARMKAMHGVCLRPGIARLELRVRAHNRTAMRQTFLWWANVATRVHEAYQSFFPPDATFVADHAKRATSAFPLCDDRYYGVDYAGRARDGVPASEYPEKDLPPACGGKTPVDYPANDLSFYANIPVPTSYMCMGTREDFFGGYDFKLDAGIIHLANHHISPGKKQWTWGNHAFGYAWDRNLTDPDAQGECPPYIELMAGVYTDNQPDFSYLQPGETKTWTQYWAPLQAIGPAHHANNEAALSLVCEGNACRIGVAVFRAVPSASVCIYRNNKRWKSFQADLAPDHPFLESLTVKTPLTPETLRVEVRDAEGNPLLNWTPRVPTEAPEVPPPATEPPPPEKISGNDELYITGLHLAQYRHATRAPEAYWREALRRDPGDSRCHTAMAEWHLRRGEFSEAETHARAAIERLTLRNPNPANGEALYLLGETLRYLERFDEATDAYYKATWNQAWAAAAFRALAEIACRDQDWSAALDHLDRALRLDADNLACRNLRVMGLRILGQPEAANAQLADTLRLDPLDGWARCLETGAIPADAQACLDLAHDLARAGLHTEAISILKKAPTPKGDLPDQSWGTAPLVAYTLGWLYTQSGQQKEARAAFKQASALPHAWCFPARLEEIAVLRHAIASTPKDARAPYYLGNLLYDRRRHTEAIQLWELAVERDPGFASAHRNLGIGYFNVLGKPGKAKKAYETAFQLAPDDARLLYERDQLWKKLERSPAKRLRELEAHRALVNRRDDLSVELCALYNQTGSPEKALAILESRPFQPWEGGEGQTLGQYKQALLQLGKQALDDGEPQTALQHLQRALTAPDNLGESYHLLANQSDLLLALGDARQAVGDEAGAKDAWTAAATFQGDFQNMRVQSFSEMTFYSAMAWRRLGHKKRATRLLKDLLAYARSLEKETAKIDYFATSLPTMLLFEDDIQARQMHTARFLQKQALTGLGK